MRKFYLMSALCLVTVLGLCGCKSSTPPEDLQPVPEARDEPPAAGYNSGLGGNGGSGFGPGQGGAGSWQQGATEDAANKSGGGAGADGWTEADPSGNRFGMPIVYFAFDSDALIETEQQKLNNIAEFMGNNPALGLVIEGHCDQRGTDEYNRSLGERRANAIRTYLVGRGVADNRIRTVSFGKDKPAVQGSGEEVWKKNRRGVPVPMKMGR